jgi:hypothetical protein
MIPAVLRRSAPIGSNKVLPPMKFRPHWPDMPHALVMRTIRPLGEQVLPACRSYSPLFHTRPPIQRERG